MEPSEENNQNNPESNIPPTPEKLPSADDLDLLSRENLILLKTMLEQEIKLAQKKGNTGEQDELGKRLGLIEKKLQSSK